MNPNDLIPLLVYVDSKVGAWQLSLFELHKNRHSMDESPEWINVFLSFSIFPLSWFKEKHNGNTYFILVFLFIRIRIEYSYPVVITAENENDYGPYRISTSMHSGLTEETNN